MAANTEQKGGSPTFWCWGGWEGNGVSHPGERDAGRLFDRLVFHVLQDAQALSNLHSLRYLSGDDEDGVRGTMCINFHSTPASPSIRKAYGSSLVDPYSYPRLPWRMKSGNPISEGCSRRQL
jgi:hypothetical protein